MIFFFFFQAEDGIRDGTVTGVQTCALPISPKPLVVPGQARARSRRLDARSHLPLAGPGRDRDRDQARLEGRCLLPSAPRRARRDRKSTRLNSSHSSISYAVFCLKKKKKNED